jgi:hypothetical protein
MLFFFSFHHPLTHMLGEPVRVSCWVFREKTVAIYAKAGAVGWKEAKPTVAPAIKMGVL